MVVEIFPIGHVWHALKPVVLEYLPAVQAIQVAREVAPTVADAVPAAQFAQVVAEAPEFFPATQVRQAEAANDAEAYLPAVQATWETKWIPVVHGMQAFQAPLENKPLAQGVHVAATVTVVYLS